MRNYVEPGVSLTTISPAGGIFSGEGHQVGGIFGVAAYSAAEGTEVEIATQGVFELAKWPHQGWSVGDAIYWDKRNRIVTNTAGDFLRIGFAVANAAESSTCGRVLLVPGAVLVGALEPSNGIPDAHVIAGGNPGEAEYNDLVSKVNGILAALRSKNILANA